MICCRRSLTLGRLVVVMTMVLIVTCLIAYSLVTRVVGDNLEPIVRQNNEQWDHRSRLDAESGPSDTQRKPVFMGIPLSPIRPVWEFRCGSGGVPSVCIHSVCTVDKECDLEMRVLLHLDDERGLEPSVTGNHVRIGSEEPESPGKLEMRHGQGV
jgi:hypothetical protein